MAMDENYPLESVGIPSEYRVENNGFLSPRVYQLPTVSTKGQGPTTVAFLMLVV